MLVSGLCGALLTLPTQSCEADPPLRVSEAEFPLRESGVAEHHLTEAVVYEPSPLGLGKADSHSGGRTRQTLRANPAK